MKINLTEVLDQFAQEVQLKDFTIFGNCHESN